MKTNINEKGFTLVELAIVMAIIGLLIGGILKGQELMENARVASTVTQVKAIEASVTTFRDTFNGIPGDLARADQRLPGCPGAAKSCLSAGAAGVGDGTVGTPNEIVLDQGVNATTPLPGTLADETTLFWTHLLLADLLGGLTNAAIQDGSFAGWGDTHPAAKIGGGFVVAHSGGASSGLTTAIPGRGGPDGDGLENVPVGTVLVLRSALGGTLNATAGVQAISPLRAAQIDRRIDDGKSASGTVQAYGVATSCFVQAVDGGGAAIAGVYDFNETLKSKDCGLFLQIQG